MPIADDLAQFDPEPAEELAALELHQPMVEPQINPAEPLLPDQEQMLNPPPNQQPAQDPVQLVQQPNHQDPVLENNNHLEPDLNVPTEQLPELCSKSTQFPSFISFRNNTERVVDIYWVDYKGHCVHYKSLEPNNRISVNTYETHPWVFRDQTSRAKLVVNNNQVFMPRHFTKALRSDPSGDVRPFRVCYDITIPIYSLKERATQVVLSLAQSEANIGQLELPAILRKELLRAVHHRDTGAITP